MDFFEQILSLINNPDLVFRLFLLVLLTFYGLFALILAFQIRSLNTVVRQVTFSSVFTTVSFIHAGIALFLMLFVIMLL